MGSWNAYLGELTAGGRAQHLSEGGLALNWRSVLHILRFKTVHMCALMERLSRRDEYSSPVSLPQAFYAKREKSGSLRTCQSSKPGKAEQDLSRCLPWPWTIVILAPDLMRIEVVYLSVEYEDMFDQQEIKEAGKWAGRFVMNGLLI